MKKHILIAASFSLFALTGCVKLWQDNIEIKTFMVNVERSGEPAAASSSGKLWIEDVQVLPPYNVRSLTVRESDVEYSTSYYSELLMSPSENFRNLFFDWFSAGRLFEVVSVSDRRNLDHRLIATVMQFYGDRESQEAVLRIKVSLLDKREKVLLHKDYMQRIKAASATAEDYIRAYNEATMLILTECEKDIAQAIAEK